MLGNAPYNFGTITKIITAFGWLFSDISIQRVNPDTTVKTIKVPIEFAQKEKWDQRNTVDPDAGNEETQRHVAQILPRMGYELTGFRYDPNRKLSGINYRIAATETNTEAFVQLNPVPFIFTFSLYLQARTLSDGWNIVEQIVPNFRPDYVVPIIDIPEMDIRRDIPFVLLSMDQRDRYEGTFTDKRVIEWQFDFEAKGHMYAPIKRKKIIDTVEVSLNPDAWQYPVSISTINPPDANIDEDFEVVETEETRTNNG